MIKTTGASLNEPTRKTLKIDADQQIVLADGGFSKLVGLHRIFISNPNGRPLGRTWEDMLTDEVRAKLLD